MQAAATRSSRYSLLTVGQLVVSVSGALLSLLAVCLLIYFGSTPVKQPGISAVTASIDPYSSWILGLLALMGVLSSINAVRKLKSIRQGEATENLLRFGILLLPLWIGLAALTAYMMANQIARFLYPPLDLLLVILPLLMILLFGLSKIQSGTVQHFWGLFTGSLFVTMPLVMFIEVAIVIIGVILFGFNLASNTGLLQSLTSISQMELTTQAQTDQFLTQLLPILTTPIVVYALIFGLCILTPVIEEFLKPLMIWAFARRSLTPAQGFGMGLICGAAFALLESAFAMGAVSNQDIVIVLLSRTGTSMLHTLSSGMMGWAIVAAWHDGNVVRTGLVYIGVVLMHGLWNFFAIIGIFTAFSANLPPELVSLSSASPWLLALLFIWMITVFWFMKNRILNHTPAALPSLRDEWGDTEQA